MGFKAYYDSSGKNDNVSKLLTLAGFSAPENIWSRFEIEWKKVLINNNIQYFHMSDAKSLRGNFDPRNGWDENRANNLVKDLLNVIGKFRTKRFETYSCSIILSDYRRAKQAVTSLRSPEAICVNFCVGGLQLANEDLNLPKSIRLFFDQNETFLNTIYTVWDREKNKDKTSGWPKQIISIDAVNSKTTYPIQAADMFAWMINRHYTHQDEEYWSFLTYLLAEHYSKMYDYDKIIEEYAKG